MKAYIAEHEGIYLPGYSFIVAPNVDTAKEKLKEILEDYGIKAKKDYIKLKEVDIKNEGETMIWTGDY